VPALFGDSGWQGMGAADTAETLGARLAAGLADRGYRVRVPVAARTGARARDLAATAARLREQGADVVVAASPDLGTVGALHQRLRGCAGPPELFAPDGLHPSERGYAAVADPLLPAIIRNGRVRRVERAAAD
jgi:lysophospholipase L1-like esterase